MFGMKYSQGNWPFVASKFDGLTTYGIRQSWLNLSLHQMCLLRHCLWADLGLTLFSPANRVIQVVGLEHVMLQTSLYAYVWGKRSIMEQHESLNHGQGHSRITLTFIAHWQIDNG
jgi:hypothetical protein